MTLNKLLSLTLVFGIGSLLEAQNLKLNEGFRRADSNGDGKLSADEVTPFLQFKTKIQGADKNGDGHITLEEFSTHFFSGVSAPLSAATKLTVGEHTRTVSVGDLQRRYRVHVPEKYDAANPSPVVIVFHGGGGNPESMVRLTGMNAKSDEAGFIVVYPYGSGLDPERGLTFNGGGCCGYAMQRKIDDVGFTRALLDDLATVANVDSKRVFATGLSNGGIMSHYVASELSDRIAAIAPVGGPLMMDAPNAKRPVPVMHFHGTGDEFAPFNGGFGKGALGRAGITEFRSVDHTIQSWVKANGCKPEPEVIALPDKADDGMKCTRKTWSGGEDGREVVLIEIENGGHTWPGNEPIVAMLGKSTKDISANDLMWAFFQEHPMKSTEAVTEGIGVTLRK
jgi:polyhydroxybutyrate depolymerase